MREQLDDIAERLEPRFPTVAAMLAEAKDDVTALTAFPVSHWRKIWSTNPLERVNMGIKRRTDVVGIFPKEVAILRLAGAVWIPKGAAGLSDVTELLGQAERPQAEPVQDVIIDHGAGPSAHRFRHDEHEEPAPLVTRRSRSQVSGELGD